MGIRISSIATGLAALVFGSFLVAGCGGGGVLPAQATIFGLWDDGLHFSRFTSGLPSNVFGTKTITGLQPGETILAIDFRPANKQMYGLGSTSRIYRINVNTGAATQVGAGAFSPALDGTKFAMDFNPVGDFIRIVSDTSQHLRIDPDTGAMLNQYLPVVYTVGDMHEGSTPVIAGMAHTNNTAAATETTVYLLDSGLDIVSMLGSVNGTPVSPNTGEMSTMGDLGLDADAYTGFDIAPGGSAYATATSGPGPSSLYSVDLATGALMLIGIVGNPSTHPMLDIAVKL